MTSERLQRLLDRATTIKPGSDLEPPLPVAEFQGSKGLGKPKSVDEIPSHFARIELAARRTFHDFVVSSDYILRN